VRGRKRDGRRSSLPPPPPGQQDVAPAERDSRDSESDDLEGRSVGDEGGERASSSEAVIVVAAAEVVAVDPVLPKSASALLSGAIPSSARTKAVTRSPSSGSTPVASARAEAKAPDEEPEPEPTPILDMPALLEERQERVAEPVEAAQPEIPTSTEPSAEVTRPDVKALALEGEADGAEDATSSSDEDTDADLKRADPPARQGSIPDPTEVSFFDPATVSAHIARAHEPSDAHDIHSLSQAELLNHRRALPEVAARRARLAKFVKITVGTAAALLVLAVLLHLSARSGRAGGQTSEMLVAPPSTAAAESPPDPVKTTAATVPATAPTGAGNAATNQAALDAAVTGAPSASAAVPVALPTDMSPDAAAAAALPLAKFAQLSLERGKLADAIDAGEQATALDPTDARSWLVLGGAYQDRGDMQKARRCYNSCVGHATRGPVNECRALGGR
jgi:tetratricopeptide (TPR) repeat protein